MIYVVLALGVLAIAASWDAFRRYVEAKRFNAGALDELKALRTRCDEGDRKITGLIDKLQTVALARRAGPLSQVR